MLSLHCNFTPHPISTLSTLSSSWDMASAEFSEIANSMLNTVVYNIPYIQPISTTSTTYNPSICEDKKDYDEEEG